VAIGVEPRSSQPPPGATSTLSTIALVWKLSPSSVRSAIGVPGAIAPGSGSFSCFARSTMDSVIAPPAEEPKIAMLPGCAIFSAAFHTVMASSSPAG